MTHQIEINHYETLIVKTNKNKIKFEPNCNTSDTLGLFDNIVSNFISNTQSKKYFSSNINLLPCLYEDLY